MPHPPLMFDNMSLLSDVEITLVKGDIDVRKAAFQNSISMLVKRIIHPVGQGAFYSEKIYNNDRKFNIIYDCGSSTTYKVNGKKQIIETEVESYYHKNEIIDLLFISHFDNDHVNGLEYLKKYCKIKRVVMPLIPDSAKCFYLAQLNENIQQLITDPQGFFGEETEIITVKYTNRKESEQDELVLSDNTPKTKREIVNGTMIQFHNLCEWCYIPFNFDEKARYDKLIEELETAKLDKDKLLKGDVEYIIENRAKINKVYGEIIKKRGSSNESSLIVYSGPTCTQHSFCRKRNFKFGYYGTIPRLSLKNVACLYLGDMNLNQTCKSGDLCVNLRLSLDNVIENIGLIQVPHHGSKKSFNDDILFIFKDICVYFASFGKQNMYGHPSYKVVEDIEMHNHFIGVTEDRNSALVETIYHR